MPDVESYQEVAIAVYPEDVDAVSNYIIENISTGILLEDEEGNSHTIIKFYVSPDASIEERLSGLCNYLLAVNNSYDHPIVSTKKISSIDWIEAYRQSVCPIEIAENIVIVPPWDEGDYGERQVIIIEPKMAFGTGRHETTRSCLAELEGMDLSGKTMLDLGCGSGILSIYAANQGAKKVVGYDIDPLAVDNSQENFEINKVTDICRAYLGSIDDIDGGERYDVVVANIIKKVIVPIVGRLKDIVKPGGGAYFIRFVETGWPGGRRSIARGKLARIFYSLRR